MTSPHDGAEDRDGGGGRLPLLDPTTLREDQRELYDSIVEYSVPWAERAGFRARTDGGRLLGPFNGFLHSPALAKGHSRAVTAEQRHTTLAAGLREVVILTVGVAWRSAYEIYAHVAVARSLGVDEAVIAGIRDGATTAAFSPEEGVVHDFVQSLVVHHAVDDVLYRHAVDLLGRQAVVDMVHLVGLYLATSALLNAFEVPAPEIPEP